MLYFDYAASAPMRPAARDAWLATAPGNPASPHAYGRRAEEAVERARQQVGALLGRPARGLVWTSGGTEADNLALLGVAKRASGRHLIVSAIEHKAVLGPAEALAKAGWTLDLLPVDGDGVVELTRLEGLLRPDTALVSVMAVNNEVGSVQPVGAIASLLRERGVLFHVDASQAGYLDLSAIDLDLMTLSAHKLGGPPGVGALWVRGGTSLGAASYGGAHERGLRPGSLNAPGIVAFGAAAEEIRRGRTAEAAKVGGLRDRLAARIVEGVPTARWLGRSEARAPQILALSFPGLEGEALVTQLDLAGLAASTGAACTTLGLAPGHVLPAMGLDAATIAGSLRLSLGWATTEREVDEAAAIVVRTARMLLSLKPLA